MDIHRAETHLESLGTRELLRQYAATLALLEDRGVIRSKNAPSGDLAETLVRAAYGATLAPKSQKSWDIELPDGKTLQVKSRVMHPGSGNQVFSLFRSWEFDRCVFVVFEGTDYSVRSGVDVPVDSFLRKTSYSTHSNGYRIGVSFDLLGLPGAVDVTTALNSALEEL